MQLWSLSHKNESYFERFVHSLAMFFNVAALFRTNMSYPYIGAFWHEDLFLGDGLQTSKYNCFLVFVTHVSEKLIGRQMQFVKIGCNVFPSVGVGSNPDYVFQLAVVYQPLTVLFDSYYEWWITEYTNDTIVKSFHILSLLSLHMLVSDLI